MYHDPYGSLRSNLQYGSDLGLKDVAGRSCRVLAFVEKDIDWNIWIATATVWRQSMPTRRCSGSVRRRRTAPKRTHLADTLGRQVRPRVSLASP